MEEKKKGCACAFPIILGVIVITVVLINVFSKPKNTSSVTSRPGLADTSVKTFDGYYLRFADDFKPGMTTVDDLGLSIVIAVDVSGSMKEYPKRSGDKEKYIVASESLSDIVKFLQNVYEKSWKKENIKLKVGIIKFSNKVDIVYDLTEMTSEEFQKLRVITNNANNFYPNGSTAIGRTLEKGTEMLVQSGTIFKSLLVISDGENTSGTNPEDVMDAIVNNKNNKTTDDFPVSTQTVLVSFIGFDMDASVFSRLHQQGARVMTAGNKEELNKSMTDIFLADINKLEAK